MIIERIVPASPFEEALEAMRQRLCDADENVPFDVAIEDLRHAVTARIGEVAVQMRSANPSCDELLRLEVVLHNLCVVMLDLEKEPKGAHLQYDPTDLDMILGEG
jgi:hypothetical protein